MAAPNPAQRNLIGGTEITDNRRRAVSGHQQPSRASLCDEYGHRAPDRGVVGRAANYDATAIAPMVTGSARSIVGLYPPTSRFRWLAHLAREPGTQSPQFCRSRKPFPDRTCAVPGTYPNAPCRPDAIGRIYSAISTYVEPPCRPTPESRPCAHLAAIISPMIIRIKPGRGGCRRGSASAKNRPTS